jgi:hypothetical protein
MNHEIIRSKKQPVRQLYSISAIWKQIVAESLGIVADSAVAPVVRIAMADSGL